ncbi:chitinase [Salmonella enterica subsp. enterica serovar Manhattan]|nr:chitinase [Salmonella enterica subsp. enterica serovar Manhattan]EDP8877107.1 chitinase [Salmonella enterica subsp. enterica]HAK0693259.1 chitinase [Salmonella enterica]EBF8145288.1 chitinase [Salmonella enterica subsp. enterica serovar Manhattan]EBU8486660.1 chitinase [Salmonella enterica subsp. enterica serovar Manhattan]
MTISIHASAFDVNSWYQKITLTFINESGNAVDMNHAAISFTASGHIDPWGNSGGTLKGNLPLTLNDSSYGTLETNNIIINNSDALLLQPGERGTLSFSLAATQVPVKMSAITLTLASSSSEDAESETPSDQETPAIPAADEQPAEPDVPEKDNDLQEHGLTLNVSELNTASWYQRVTFTLTNLYAQAVDLNQLQLNFTASAHPDPYSPFQGTMLGNQAVTLASDGGWPIEKNTITINHDGALMLAAGDTAELQCYLAATQTPVAISDLNATLAHDPARQGKICVHFPAMTQTVALKPVIELLFPAGETRRFVGEWGEVLTIGDLSAGTYRLTVPVLANDEMQIAPVESSFTVTLQSGDAAAQVQVSCLPIVRYASARLMIDAPALGNAKLTVEIADTTQADERTITLIANQPQLITRLLAGHHYTVNLQPAMINNRFISAPIQLTGFIPAAAQIAEVAVAYQQSALDTASFVTVNAPETVSLYRDIPFSALFKYDGFDGGGDPVPAAEVDVNGDGFLDYATLPIHKTVALVRQIEKEAGRSVMPVMVIYTANASGGSALADLQDAQKLRNHFGNFITQCLAAQSYKDETHPVPATFVLNPDFLGALQQGPYGYTVVRQKNSVPVNAQLAAAIQALPAMAGFIVPSLPTFSDDLYGYIQAVNYLVRQFAPDVAFGWQTNVWATGTADWVLRDTADPVAEGQAIAGFIHELGVYSGEYAPDFIAFDKFERDCFSPDALAHYGWNATCWLNYLAMVKQVTKALLTPAMLWQIPGGHMPTVEEGVSKISAAHFASGGTFFMGDARIGSDPDTLSLQLLNTALNSATYGVPTVGDFLRKDKGYDWGQMQALNLPDFNVFSILWGGGSTISITTIHSNGEDGGWLADKMVEYYAAPRYFR